MEEKMKNMILSFLVLLILAACGGEPTPTTTQYTATAQPSETSLPTETFTPIPTKTPTITATPTTKPIPTATQVVIPTPEGYFIETSPDGVWGIWERSLENCGSELTITEIDQGIQNWTISDQGYDPSGLMLINLKIFPLHWSTDGAYLYVVTDIACADGGLGYYGVYTLKRLNLATGEISDILNTGAKYEVSISPNSRHLIFIDTWEDEFVINFQDFRTGEITELKIDKLGVAGGGEFIWSPDSTKVVFFVVNENEDIFIVLVDRQLLEYKILALNNYVSGSPIEWINDKEVLLDLITFGGTIEQYLWDTTTGKLTVYEP